MMRKNYIVLLLLVLTFSCKKKDKVNPGDLFQSYDRQGMLQNIGDNLILPSYRNFNDWTDSLSAACTQFVNQPDEAHLLAAQSKWKTTSSWWMQSELYNFGPEDELLLRPVINTWPVSTTGIESAIQTSAAIDNNYIDARSKDAKGLNAIEYLLFDPVNGNSAVLNTFTSGSFAENRKNYLTALCQNLHGKANTLYTAWQPSGGNYIQTFVKADGNDVSSSIGLLVNQIAYLTDEIKSMKLDTSAGAHRESHYSQTSLDNIKDNLTALENAFLGRSLSGSDQQGLDDLLNHLKARYNDQSLADVIKAKFDNAQSKVNAITPPLENAGVNNSQQMQDAYTAMKALLVVLKVDMVNNLGVLLTFTDNDGD